MGSTARYGIGELYGRSLWDVPADERRALASPGHPRDCPFDPDGGRCTKRGGVCSLRLYERASDDTVRPASDDVVTVCPKRFLENGVVYRWIGKTLLGLAEDEDPVVLTELPFLLPFVRNSPDGSAAERAVGKIDVVLLHPDFSVLRWCCVEMQAVYFSGPKMGSYLEQVRKTFRSKPPFPEKGRRPDFRSSGPKRLMPQLQIKVPTISRWGKKTAVVVDHAFWRSLAPMAEVEHVSNCDIAWFVVRYIREGARFVLTPYECHLTTLARAVEGLTAGRPTSLDEFEKVILRRIERVGGAQQHPTRSNRD